MIKVQIPAQSLKGDCRCHGDGDERPDSDAGILVEFKGRADLARFMDTKFYLEDLLGCKVDLVTPKAIKPRMKPYIMQDLVYVA